MSAYRPFVHRFHQLLSLLSLLFLVSCNGDRKAEDMAEETVVEWIGKEIVFPDSMIFVVQGDTVDYSWQNADYKVVTYSVIKKYII